MWSPSGGMNTRGKENSLLTTDPYIMLPPYVSHKGLKLAIFKGNSLEGK